MEYFPMIVSSTCGILLLLLVGALIVNRSFRSDVLGGEGEATVFGLLSIKGVAIVLLCGLFLWGFIYPLNYFSEVSSKEIKNIISAGLKNKNTEAAFVGSLMQIIESQQPNSPLGEKLVELAEARHSPFNFSSKPVKLAHGTQIPQGFVGVCENSDFIKKNITVFILGENNEMTYRITLFAESKYAFPCAGDHETLVINIQDITITNQGKTFAKRTL